MNKIIVNIFFALFFIIFFVGVGLPFLFSAKSMIAVVLGFTLIPFIIIVVIWFFKRIFKLINEEMENVEIDK